MIHEYFQEKKLTFFKAYDWSNLKQLFAAWNFFNSLVGKALENLSKVTVFDSVLKSKEIFYIK